ARWAFGGSSAEAIAAAELLICLSLGAVQEVHASALRRHAAGTVLPRLRMLCGLAGRSAGLPTSGSQLHDEVLEGHPSLGAQLTAETLRVVFGDEDMHSWVPLARCAARRGLGEDSSAAASAGPSAVPVSNVLPAWISSSGGSLISGSVLFGHWAAVPSEQKLLTVTAG
ncbi:unnamed protein product, partial [Polarella glacialis]